MKIIRHTARDMRQALRAVREQLGEDAVILSSRRTDEGVEITAAIDFDASTLEAGGFANTPAPTPPPPPQFAAPAQLAAPTQRQLATPAAAIAAPAVAAAPSPARAAIATAPSSAPTAARSSIATNPTVLALTMPRGSKSNVTNSTKAPAVVTQSAGVTQSTVGVQSAAVGHPAVTAQAAAVGQPTAIAQSTAVAMQQMPAPVQRQAAGAQGAVAHAPQAAYAQEPSFAPQPSYDALAQAERLPDYVALDDGAWISEAAREAVAEHVAAPRAPVLAPAPPVGASAAPSVREIAAETALDIDLGNLGDEGSSYEDRAHQDPVEEIREATLTPLASNEIKAAFAEFQAAAATAPAATEAMGNELKTLRRMLETQLAHLAWNDLTRRAPVHTEILRELTEIGISPELAEHLVRQLPEDTELTFARRFTIAGLSQYLKVTGDHWLDDGGRVAFVGATGVGKTTTLAKIAVRWVLRHGPRDIALIAADSVRIGAQDQLQSLAQLLGVPVYTPEKFESLPTLLTRLNERLILIDTPGASVRDPQLAGRLAVLSNSASKLETALVLAASTQAGAIEEAVKHFAPANPACCVLTKLDEAASLGGLLSVLIRARLPISYMSEGQRVPEDLRPARALELVSAAVRLAKARGAAADEDLLRRRFGKTAHGIS